MAADASADDLIQRLRTRVADTDRRVDARATVFSTRVRSLDLSGLLSQLGSVKGMRDLAWTAENMPGLSTGLLIGLLLGVATDIIFPLVILGPLLGIGLGWAALHERPPDRRQASAGGGVLIGLAAVYLVFWLNTAIPCAGQDVCGGTSALPLLGLAIATSLAGLLIEAQALRMR